MITLKSGAVIEFDEDFDVFFQNLIKAIIEESFKAIDELAGKENEDDLYTNQLLKEIMDNCIYITHQIFQTYAKNENLAKFLITGCLFNCSALTLSQTKNSDEKDSEEGTLH